MHSLCIAEISRHEAVFLSQTMWVCQTGIGTGVDGDKKVLTEQLQFVYNSQLLYVSSSSRRLQLLRLAKKCCCCCCCCYRRGYNVGPRQVYLHSRLNRGLRKTRHIGLVKIVSVAVVRGYSRSSKVVPIESPYAMCY